jgi:TctA family transporter
MRNKRDVNAGVLLIMIGIGVIIRSIRLQLGTLAKPLPGFFSLSVLGSSLCLSCFWLRDAWGVAKRCPRPTEIILPAGIYYGAQYGGSATSLLLNIPGEASSIVTCLDGC